MNTEFIEAIHNKRSTHIDFDIDWHTAVLRTQFYNELSSISKTFKTRTILEKDIFKLAEEIRALGNRPITNFDPENMRTLKKWFKHKTDYEKAESLGWPDPSDMPWWSTTKSAKSGYKHERLYISNLKNQMEYDKKLNTLQNKLEKTKQKLLKVSNISSKVFEDMFMSFKSYINSLEKNYSLENIFSDNISNIDILKRLSHIGIDSTDLINIIEKHNIPYTTNYETRYEYRDMHTHVVTTEKYIEYICIKIPNNRILKFKSYCESYTT